ncbi:ABC transporter substrate-binding protein [Frankia sp. AgB1.9]|uniref:ABC transporter substrate-binding protein n=1 Tax=unclassified Frankia TaxID=2632575 RepID=UPI0019323801|nr:MULTISPECIES: ABC transporter substrate-binding protein [unclassified Frankia]MBL7494573.1 ABC transporter substrate-binding protein [Frankia sp. AgW1.1]MBL7551635.1 ABC transporter substrate-binding protein [Frankia sp. AgB1.9]MBL7624198.1 ABC transporter substrate-binding protein [Frankia sp. AgB1.8]
MLAAPIQRLDRRTTLTAIAATLLAALATVSCTNGSGPANTSAACAAPGVSPHEIRVGLIYPDSGPISGELEAARSGADARFGLVNAAGGINGRKITYTWQDDNSSTSGNGTAVRSLFESTSVFGLLEASINADGGADYLRSNQIPAVGLPITNVWSDPSYTTMFSYPSLITGGPVSDVVGRYVREHGGHRAIVVTTETASGVQGFDPPLAKSFAEAQVPTTTVPYNSAVTSPSEFVRRLPTDSDVLVLALGPNDVLPIDAAVNAAGNRFKVVVAIAGSGDATIQKYGSSVAGLTTFSTIVPFRANLPAQQDYLKAVATYAPELQPATQEVALGTYIAADILVQGLIAAGACPTRTGFINALRGMQNYNAEGMLAGKVDFTKTHQEINCLIFTRVNDAGTAFEVVPDTVPGAPSQTEWCGAGS